jgi:hypothetical protein
MSSVPSSVDDSNRPGAAQRSASGARLMGRARAALDRDAALVRIRRVRGWTIVAAAALSAGLTGLVSAIAPGKSLGAAKHLTAKVTRRAHYYMKTPLPALPPLASTASLGLVPPSTPPASVSGSTNNGSTSSGGGSSAASTSAGGGSAGGSSAGSAAAATAAAQAAAAQAAAAQQAAAQQAAAQQAAAQQAAQQGIAQGGGGLVSGGS